MLCDYETEYPCLRNVQNIKEDLWNFTVQNPCIPLSQIGDDIIHCYGGRDEKNTLRNHISGGALGNSHKCSNASITISYMFLCGTRGTCPDLEDTYGCLNNRAPLTAQEDSNICGNNERDVICLSGDCKKLARCNGTFDCKYGEDEYMCYLYHEDIKIDPIDQKVIYRYSKIVEVGESRNDPEISDFPPSSHFILENKKGTTEKIIADNFYPHQSKAEMFDELHIAYNCNRGVTIHNLQSGNLTCFCPPSYYGEHCEYYSDRLTVATHLDYTNSPYLHIADDSVVLKVLCLFLFDSEVVDHYSFQVRPVDDHDDHPVKHKFFFLYSRATKYLNHKQGRYSNRTDIINSQPYSVRFELYELIANQPIKLVGLWRFPIYFDYLPASRLAKVLRFPSTFTSIDPCQSNPCNPRSVCQRIFNKISTLPYTCLCKPSYYGRECALINANCSTFCAPNSICKPGYNGLLISNHQPLCLCPLHYYGPRCYLKSSFCFSQPCQNNGTCIEVGDPTRSKPYSCKCTVDFDGDNCQNRTIPVYIQMNLTNHTAFSSASVLASVVQYLKITENDDLYMVQQKASLGLQLHWQYSHTARYAPSFAFYAAYDSNYRLTGPLLYLLYIQQDADNVSVTIELNELNYCRHSSTLMNRTSKFSMSKRSTVRVFENHFVMLI